MKKSIKKIFSALLASAMVISSVTAVTYADKPTDWSIGVEDKDSAIEKYTVSQAKSAEFDVPVKVFNNANLNNYTVYVQYNPSELMVIGATEGEFSMSSADLMAKSVNHIPAVGNPSFPSADGVKKEAELGKIKFAYSADVDGAAATTAAELTAFTLKFKVVAENPKVGDKYHIAFTYDDAALYSDDLTTKSGNVSNGYVEIIATQGGSSTGSGNSGGYYKPATTTTTTEATTAGEGTDADDTTKDNVTLNEEDHYAYVVGYPDGNVKPQGQITRAEVATIFFRLLSDSTRDSYFSQENDYSDVNMGLWFHNAVSTMDNAGIVHGYDDGTFKPNKSITRAEFATIAAHFDNSAYTGENKFSDIDGHWAAEYINIAAERGWIKGYTDGTFKPDQNITRAEAMTLINSMLNRNVDVEGLLDEMVKWPDNSNVDAWYYTNVQEATNSHHYVRDEEGIEEWTELREVRDWAALERSYIE